MTKPSSNPSAPTQGLQRYDHDQIYRGSGDYDCNGMSKHDTGVYVEYDDHLADKAAALSALVAERDRLRRALTKIEAELDQTADVDGGFPNEAMRVLTIIREVLK